MPRLVLSRSLLSSFVTESGVIRDAWVRIGSSIRTCEFRMFPTVVYSSHWKPSGPRATENFVCRSRLMFESSQLLLGHEYNFSVTKLGRVAYHFSKLLNVR